MYNYTHHFMTRDWHIPMQLSFIDQIIVSNQFITPIVQAARMVFSWHYLFN